MIKKFIPLLFVACGIVSSADAAVMGNAAEITDAIEQINSAITRRLGPVVTFSVITDADPEIMNAISKWKTQCKNFTSTNSQYASTHKITATDLVSTVQASKITYQCVVTSCTDGYIPDTGKTTCTEKKKTAKEKMAEHNQEYLAKQNASKLKTQIEQINKSADKLKLGDKLKWNASFNDDAGINAALKAWVDKCDTLATGNIADTTTLGRESDGEFKCVIKTCKNGFTKNKSGTVCTNDPAAAEFADKFQEINDKFKSDVAAAWQAHNASQAKSTK